MRIPNFRLLSALLLSALATPSVSCFAQGTGLNPASVLIDFDYDAQGVSIAAPGFFLSAGVGPLTTLYAPLGVLFSGPQAGTGGVIVNKVKGYFTVPTRSGPNFLAFSNDKYAHSPETITFTSPVSSVTIYAISPGTSLFTMTAYDSLGLPLTSSSALALEYLPPNYDFPYYPLTVTTSAAQPIDHVVLTQQSVSPPNNEIYEYDDLTFTPISFTVPNAVVTGRVALEGVDDFTAISAAAPVGSLAITLRTPGTTADHYFYSAPLTPAGSGSPFGTFALNVPYGTYDVAIKSDKSLRSVIASFVVSGPASLPDTFLTAGDANNDNAVDATDFGLFVGAYNSDSSVAGSGYDARADFNYDGAIDATDFGLFVGNYNTTGTP